MEDEENKGDEDLNEDQLDVDSETEEDEEREIDWEAKYRESQREAAKWKANSRKNESNYKKLQKEQMTDADKALADAEAKGEEKARTEYAKLLVAAELKAALADVVSQDDISDILSDVREENYLTDDGTIDTDKVSAFRKRYQKLMPKGKNDPGVTHGPRGKKTTGPEQLTRADLAGMSTDEVVKAKEAGKLNDILGIK